MIRPRKSWRVTVPCTNDHERYGGVFGCPDCSVGFKPDDKMYYGTGSAAIVRAKRIIASGQRCTIERIVGQASCGSYIWHRFDPAILEGKLG